MSDTASKFCLYLTPETHFVRYSSKNQAVSTARTQKPTFRNRKVGSLAYFNRAATKWLSATWIQSLSATAFSLKFAKSNWSFSLL